MLMLIVIEKSIIFQMYYLNTSHVNVNQRIAIKLLITSTNLNTSHVNVNLV